MPTNTGEQEKEQRDTNPNSPTVGQTRFVPAGTNLHACPLPSPTYRSAAISEVVYRNDCGAGTSSGVPYTVPAGQVVSTISQADADAQARAYFDNSKQTYAQGHATCNAAATRTCQLDPVTGCFTGYMTDGTNTFNPTPQECQACYVTMLGTDGIDRCGVNPAKAGGSGHSGSRIDST